MLHKCKHATNATNMRVCKDYPSGERITRDDNDVDNKNNSISCILIEFLTKWLYEEQIF